MRTRRLISLSLLLLILAITPVTYVISPYIGRYLLESWLTEQGFTQLNFELTHPGWGIFETDGVQLSYQTKTYQVHLSTGKISLSFDPYTLLTHQRLTTATIEQADIYIVPQHTTTNSVPLQLAQVSRWLPALWLPDLPTDQVNIDKLTISVQATEDKQWHSQHQLAITAQQINIDSEFSLTDQMTLTSHAELSADNQLNWQLSRGSQPWLQLQARLQTPTTLHTALNMNIAGLSEGLAATFPEFALPTGFSGQLDTTGTIDLPQQLAFPADTLNTITSRQNIALTLARQSPNGNIRSHLAGTLMLDKGLARLNIEPNASLTLANWSVPQLTKPMPKLAVTTAAPLSLQTTLSDNPTLAQLSISPTQLGLSATRLSLPQGTLESGPTLITLSQIDLANRRVRGQIESTQLTYHQPNKTWPTLTINSDFSYRDKALQQAFNIRAQQPRLKISGSARTLLSKTPSTQLKWQMTPVQLNSLTRELNTAMPWLTLPQELSLQQGELHHKGSASIDNAQLSAQLHNRITDGQLHWQQTEFHGVDWSSSTRIQAGGRWHDTGKVKLRQVKKGVTVEDVELSYTYTGTVNQGLFKLHTAKARFLEGMLALDPLQTNLTNPAFTSQLHLKGISLQQLLQLEQQPGLSGEGKISGSVPLNFAEGALSIANGRLASEAPGGTIRFQPTDNVLTYAAANKGLRMALELLQNFHYQQLSVDLSYAPDGKALLKTRLQGFNPEWSNGQPIDFNINIEENILQLIRALQLAEELSDRIEQRYSK
ncbi:YdbH domain-containing protein [Pontibacter sp. JAM-7]|uniref:YdbH domain-containing protein n=1 Tax=Pontibacter sp. JAM-7 TaxID=3366581 RepID=UPI003AF89565